MCIRDRPGLLYKVAQILAQHNLILMSARIATFGERAEDVFFIQDHQRSQVTDNSLLNKLSEQIHTALKSS